MTCKRMFNWVRCDLSRAARPARAEQRGQVAADPIWNGESDDMQVLMTRTVSADEEEYLIATEKQAPKVSKNAAKVRRLFECPPMRGPGG